MILVDTSVWIDYLRGRSTRQSARLDQCLGAQPICMGDLILTEILQGCDSESEFRQVRRQLGELPMIVLGGADIAVAAARNYRKLRSLGISVRRTIDTIIATRCIVDGLELLHADRDFEPFEKYLGLKCVV